MERNWRRSPNLYYSGRTVRPTQEKKPDKNLKPLIIILALVVIVFFISRLSLFPVKIVEVNEKYLEPSVEKFIGLGLFSRELNYKISNLAQIDPMVKSIQCSKGLPDTLSCDAQLRAVVGYWQSNNKTYTFDSEGYIFAETKDKPDAKKYLLIIDTANQNVKIGDEVATKLIIDFYSDVKKEAESKKLMYDAFRIKNSYYQFSFGVSAIGENKLANTVNVLMTTSYSASDQIKVAIELISKNLKSSITQVDVRVPGYGYVK